MLCHQSQQYFLGMSPQARETKAEIKKWDLIKHKSFCTVKEIINKMKRQPTEQERIFANDKGLISKIYKDLLTTQHQKKNKNQAIQLINGQKIEQAKKTYKWPTGT